MDLTDEQWTVLEPMIPKPRLRADGRGRPGRDPRDVLNGILWILKTGAPGADLPRRYPPYQTCHRRYQSWVRAGVLDRLRSRSSSRCLQPASRRRSPSGSWATAPSTPTPSTKNSPAAASS